MDSDYQVVIVGLGPVGAVAANLAGAAGLRTLVVERSATPYLQPRAIVFDAEIMRVFASVGLADAIAAVTRPLGGSVYLGADHQPIRTFRAATPAPGAWNPSNLFFQPQLEAILRDGLQRFPHVDVLHEHDVVATEGTPEHVAITIEDVRSGARRPVRTDYLLACDGASSATRKRLGVPLDDIGFEERWLVVDTFVDGPMAWPATHGVPDEVRDGRYSLMVCDPERPATLIPGVGRHRRWEYMLLPGELPDDVIPDEWLRARLAEWVDPAQVEVIRSAVYRFRALIAERWQVGRVFLLGDAAHQTPPFFGQGMCHGIRDAAQLIWKVALVLDGTAEAALLDSYQPEREPHVRAIVAASVAAGAAVCRLDPAEARARDAEFRRLEAERAGQPVAMTDVVPPITAGLIDRATGGQRVPEFLIGGVPLDTLLDGRFALLSLAEQAIDASTPDLRRIVVPPALDANGAVAAWLAGAAAAIIRPDRYVHSIAQAGEVAASLDRLRDQLCLVSTPSPEAVPCP